MFHTLQNLPTVAEGNKSATEEERQENLTLQLKENKE